ncbi:MAG TPA: RNA polymerase sigma factor, partial [Gemmatimonadales bacterium]|jgi:RNA polymerase sigma-70 factor (ECF subfamily)
VTEEGDGLLVRRVLAGERQVYARLVERYRDRLGRYAVRMLGNRADAEEALQDAFVRGYRSLARCTSAERFGPWLFGILVNRCRTYAARQARRQALVVTNEVAVASASVAHGEEESAWREAIFWALERLSADQREAFLLKHVEDLSYEEMEKLTGTRAPALRMRVLRAREELRRLLGEMVRD